MNTTELDYILEHLRKIQDLALDGCDYDANLTILAMAREAYKAEAWLKLYMMPPDEEYKHETPNQTTINAIEAARRGECEPTTIDEMMREAGFTPNENTTLRKRFTNDQELTEWLHRDDIVELTIAMPQ